LDKGIGTELQLERNPKREIRKKNFIVIKKIKQKQKQN